VKQARAILVSNAPVLIEPRRFRAPGIQHAPPLAQRAAAKHALSTNPKPGVSQMETDITTLVREKMTNLDEFMSEVRTDLASLKDKQQKTWQLAATGGGRMPFALGASAVADTLGALVTHSAEIKQFVSGSVRGTARVAVPGRVMKTIVTTGTDLKPGIRSTGVEPLPHEPLGVLDLISQTTLSQGVLQSVRQKTRMAPGAAVQLNEGDPKAEQAIEFTTVQLIPETLAAWIPISRQAAQDIAGLEMLIETELLYAIKVLEENMVLNGTSTFALPVQGQFTGLNTNAAAVTTASTTALDAIADLLGALIAAGVRPTGLVMNPGDALAISKLKNLNEEYLLGSPSAAPGGVLWGVAFAVSSRQPAGTVLAGDFRRGARLWFREDATVEISSEHADYFVKNLLAVRCEERLVLELVQPAYFAKVALPTGAAAVAEKRR
jgi:HK97 family phage major capsid protein